MKHVCLDACTASRHASRAYDRDVPRILAKQARLVYRQVVNGPTAGTGNCAGVPHDGLAMFVGFGSVDTLQLQVHVGRGRHVRNTSVERQAAGPLVGLRAQAGRGQALGCEARVRGGSGRSVAPACLVSSSCDTGRAHHEELECSDKYPEERALRVDGGSRVVKEGLYSGRHGQFGPRRMRRSDSLLRDGPAEGLKRDVLPALLERRSPAATLRRASLTARRVSITRARLEIFLLQGDAVDAALPLLDQVLESAPLAPRGGRPSMVVPPFLDCLQQEKRCAAGTKRP